MNIQIEMLQKASYFAFLFFVSIYKFIIELSNEDKHFDPETSWQYLSQQLHRRMLKNEGVPK